MPVRIWLPKTATGSRLKMPTGTYSIEHVAIGGDSDTADESLPDDVLHPVFLGGMTFHYENRGDVRLLYPDERSAHARRRKRTAGNTEIPRFEALAGRVNEWRLPLPESLAELLRAPKPKVDVEAASDEPDEPWASP